jgi:hypothetical protein
MELFGHFMYSALSSIRHNYEFESNSEFIKPSLLLSPLTDQSILRIFGPPT